MRELLRTNDIVLIGAVEALLKAAKIEIMLTDSYMSAIEGSIGVFPRRILVSDRDFDAARALIIEAGLVAAHPEPDDRHDA